MHFMNVIQIAVNVFNLAQFHENIEDSNCRK